MPRMRRETRRAGGSAAALLRRVRPLQRDRGRPGLQTNEARPGVIRRRGQDPPRANVVAFDAQKSDYGGSPALESWECRLRRQEDPCRTVRRAQPIGNQSFHAGARVEGGVASAVPLAPTTWVALCIWSTTTTSRSPQRNWRRARSTTTIE